MWRASGGVRTVSSTHCGSCDGSFPVIAGSILRESWRTTLWIVIGAAVGLLTPQQRNELKLGYSTEVVPKRPTDVVIVSVMGRKPEAIVAYSNALCKAYQQQSQVNNTAQFAGAADWVKTQLKDVNDKLKGKELELKDFKEKRGIIDLSTEATARANQLAEV